MSDPEVSHETQPSDERPASTPPYVAWATLQNAIERMESEGDAPSRLDRSYLKNMPGSTQSRFRQACRWLGLVGPDDAPTDTLRKLVHNPVVRKATVAALLRERYPGPLALPMNATQQMLEEAFREMGSAGGETGRKSIAFFLHACKYADIDVSKQFMQPRASRANGTAPRKPRRKSVTLGAEQAPADDQTPKNEAPNIIRDLLTKLPPEGSEWQREKVEQWLGIAKLTFEMVYDLKGEYSDSGGSTKAVPPGGGQP